jgi:hypothetical protein
VFEVLELLVSPKHCMKYSNSQYKPGTAVSGRLEAVSTELSEQFGERQGPVRLESGKSRGFWVIGSLYSANIFYVMVDGELPDVPYFLPPSCNPARPSLPYLDQCEYCTSWTMPQQGKCSL